jgi:hypothetical protein
MNFAPGHALSLFRPRERSYYLWQFFKAIKPPPWFVVRDVPWRRDSGVSECPGSVTG